MRADMCVASERSRERTKRAILGYVTDLCEPSVARLNHILDCRQDVSKLLAIGRETLLKENRNTLTVNFIEGYCNEP